MSAPRMVVGVTTAQTCLVLTGRLRALRDAGFAVTLVASPGTLLNLTAATEGVECRAIAMQRGISPLRDMRSLLEVWLLLSKLRPTITDFSTPKAGLLGNVAARMLGVPHRVYTLRGLKLESSRGSKRSLLLWLERLAARCAHVVLCNSASLLEEARALGIAPDRKLRVLGHGSSNGVDTDRFRPAANPEQQSLDGPTPAVLRRDLGIQPSELVLGFVGRLTRDKGVVELLSAFDSILEAQPDCCLLLVGWFDTAEDALEERWRTKIATHPRIVHTGYVADAAPYYRVMDMFVLPTHREGFPNVVLEASASGVAVITTESTGARDAVLPEVTGLLIPPRNPCAIVEASSTLLRDESKRRRMGAAGRAWVLDRYSKARVLALATEFYSELLKAGERPQQKK